jgi:hypothetical protein
MELRNETERLRARLRRAAAELRAATAAALAQDSWLASMLDDCRVDAERLLSLDDSTLFRASSEALFVRSELTLRTFSKLAANPHPSPPPPPRPPAPCPFCHAGTLEPLACAGRRAPFRGVSLAIPADFPIPTCNRCQAEALDDETAALLDEVLMSAWTWRDRGPTARD